MSMRENIKDEPIEKGFKRPLPLSVAAPSFRHFALVQNDGKVVVSQVREHESRSSQLVSHARVLYSIFSIFYILYSIFYMGEQFSLSSFILIFNFGLI